MKNSPLLSKEKTTTSANQTASPPTGGLQIALFQPQIPANTGNIIRTCKVTGSSLILVRPLGFSTSDRMLKRAGLDYFDGVNVHLIDDLPDYIETSGRRPLFFSSKAKKIYTEVEYEENDLLIFGSETIGLPDEMRDRWADQFYTIPQVETVRCLNLSNSAAIVLYEALRQKNFKALKKQIP